MRYTDKLGRILRHARETKGYSQEYMAEMLNIAQSSYANLESGKTSISVDRMIEIIKILQLNLHDVCGELEDGSENKLNTHSPPSVETKEAYSILVEEMKDEIRFLRNWISTQQRSIPSDSV